MASSPRPQRSPAYRALAAGLVVAGSLTAFAAQADTATDTTPAFATAPDSAASGSVPSANDTAWWQDGVAVFATLWEDARATLADDAPDWLQHLSRRKPATALPAAGAAYVVLQDDRADGMDVVTLRYRLAGEGALRAYAGAGLNHSRYFVEDPAAGPSLLTRRNRRSDLGATAELGAELALSEQVHLNADLRWADLDERAGLLHTAYGPVAADSVTLGISLGYRFR
ncbi:MAG: hypothetical protein OEX15_07290 [Gammaproteobacteria bacterium]|nr:hypothetical protein [Gammaproteobacteria bacterium]